MKHCDKTLNILMQYHQLSQLMGVIAAHSSTTVKYRRSTTHVSIYTVSIISLPGNPKGRLGLPDHGAPRLQTQLTLQYLSHLVADRLPDVLLCY